MAGSNPHEAERAYFEPVIQSLRCIIEPDLNMAARQGEVLHRALLFAHDAPLGGSSHLHLTAYTHHDIVEAPPPAGPWRVTVREFSFEYETVDRDLVYGYWYRRTDEEQVSIVTVGENEHRFPVPRLTVEQLVNLGIEFLGVEPARPDWHEILSQNLETHLAWRTS